MHTLEKRETSWDQQFFIVPHFIFILFTFDVQNIVDIFMLALWKEYKKNEKNGNKINASATTFLSNHQFNWLQHLQNFRSWQAMNRCGRRALFNEITIISLSFHATAALAVSPSLSLCSLCFCFSPLPVLNLSYSLCTLDLFGYSIFHNLKSTMNDNSNLFAYKCCATIFSHGLEVFFSFSPSYRTRR